MLRARDINDVRAVFELKAEGRTDREISHLTGVPINTIRGWRNHGLSRRRQRILGWGDFCRQCGERPHDFTLLPTYAYSYLLGVYLGDGCVTRNATSWTFRITLDEAYPGIIAECHRAVTEVSGGRYAAIRPHHGGNRCVEIATTWRAWPCLFPQHGPGRKHRRHIELVAWQQEIVDMAPEAFLRGLIHTDGWRGLNRVRAKGKDYEYPRYQFSNRSDDIRKLFTDVCDRLGVEWRPWTRYHISIARQQSVAYLDRFIGLKY
jgi:hypothetical protein